MRTLALCLLTFFASITILLFFQRWADRVGLVDHPGGRKHHAAPTPVVGGLAILCATSISAWVLPELAMANALGSVALAIVVIGVWDDRWDLRPDIKIVLQTLVATVAVLFVDQPFALQDFPGVPNWLSQLFAIFFLVALMNAINMLDGIDGLAAGASSIMLGALLVFASVSGAQLTLAVAPLFIAATLAFLIFNAPSPWRPRAAVFLGDAGSMLLGLTVGYFILDLTRAQVSPWMLSHAMALGAFPLAEMVSLSCRRISARRSPFSADRDHLHHLLLDNGVSTAGAVLIVSMIVIATAVLAGALHYSNGSYGSAILAGVFVLFLHSVVVRFLVSRRGLKNGTMSAVRSRPATLENSYLKRRAR